MKKTKIMFSRAYHPKGITWCINPVLPTSTGALQATRALMIVGIIVTVAGLGVATMGMKCSNCGGDDKIKKSRITMTGGIILLIGCELP